MNDLVQFIILGIVGGLLVGQLIIAFEIKKINCKLDEIQAQATLEKCH